jgi:hypothetical protein
MATLRALLIIAFTDTFSFKSVTSERRCFGVLWLFSGLSRAGSMNAVMFQAAMAAQGKG